MIYRKANKDDSFVHHPLKVVKLKSGYTLVDSRGMIVAEGLPKVVAEEIVSSFTSFEEAVDHLQQILTINPNEASGIQVLQAAYDFLDEAGCLPSYTRVIDFGELKSLDELL